MCDSNTLSPPCAADRLEQRTEPLVCRLQAVMVYTAWMISSPRGVLALVFVLASGCDLNAPLDPGPADAGSSVAAESSSVLAAIDAESPISAEPVDAASPADPTTAVAPSPSPAPSASQPPMDASVGPSAPSGDALDSGSRLISCDARQLRCRRAAPVCEQGHVPRIVDGCYAECVAVDTCVCDAPEACPDESQYTCINATNRCSYYLR